MNKAKTKPNKTKEIKPVCLIFSKLWNTEIQEAIKLIDKLSVYCMSESLDMKIIEVV